ncbi:MAG: hypothetical protein CMF99_06445 [Candidatus Marinimicrobia bacterium]|nr:hypothetical protein [Candidatus Neomarinimicrobiota bacterium]
MQLNKFTDITLLLKSLKAKKPSFQRTSHQDSGTEYFNFLDQANLLLNKEYQNYNQFKLVSYQEKLRSTDVEELLLEAYKKYYLRIDKISSLVFDQLKSYLPF